MTAFLRDRGAPFSGADRATIAIAVVSLVAGALVLALIKGYIAVIVGACLLGVAGIAFVALAFLLIGEGEERDYMKGPRRPR